MGDFVDEVKGSQANTSTSLKGKRNKAISLGSTNITPFGSLFILSLRGSNARFGAGTWHVIRWVASADICDNIRGPIENTVRTHIASMDGVTANFRMRLVAGGKTHELECSHQTIMPQLRSRS
jgi:hypothetical protein